MEPPQDPFLTNKSYLFKKKKMKEKHISLSPLGCDRKRNGLEGRQDLKGGGKSDARASVSVSSSGSAALFLAAEAEMESDCCHCPTVVFPDKEKPPL